MYNKGENLNHTPIQRTSYFRFYEELNDFLPAKSQKTSFPYHFTGTPSVKNSIEALGIPHVEIDLILVNGESVDFKYIMLGSEYISVYPLFESLDISPIYKLRSKPLRITKFIVDVNLGKLAKKLRLLGFDTRFKNDYSDEEIVADSITEKRIILTRDIGLLKHSAVTHGFWIRSDNPKKQLIEVIERLQLQNSFKPFSRCSNCNGELQSIKKDTAKHLIPIDTFKAFNDFWRCKDCRKIYWKGSHYDRICEWLKKLQE